MRKLSIITLASFVLLFSMCNKKSESDIKGSEAIMGQEAAQASYALTDPQVSLHYGGNYNGIPISNAINSIVSQYNLNENNPSRIPLGLAIYYAYQYQGNPLQLPSAIIYYYYDNTILHAQYWDILAQDTVVKDTTLGGITSIVSKEDMYRINDIKSLNAEEVVILLKPMMLPSTMYYSSFQTLIDYRYNIGGGNTYEPRLCNRTGDCRENYEGTCTIQEHQSGGEQTICIPSHCAAKPVANMLSQTGYPETQNETSSLYKIRDEFLLKSVKGRNYIDNYYYCSQIAIGGINLTTAMKMYALYQIGFFEKLSHFDDPTYDNTIFINSTEKPLLMDALNHAETISTDARYQSIVSGIKSDINKYENKTFSYVKSDF